jgi:4-amino-4-deoxy-L-arabinose transferase-like glycosyltransferase
MLSGGSLVAPQAAGQRTLDNPPLYYLSAAGMAKLLSPILPMHDAARLITGVWMALTLLLVGMSGRELWSAGGGRQTTFIFLGSLGLVVPAHLLMPEVSALTGCAMGIYALALARRRPFRASVLLGSGIGIGFLSTGLISAAIVAASALLLPLLFSAWRSKSYAIVLGLAALVASPWLIIWPVLCWMATPELWSDWWQTSIHAFSNFNHYYFLRTLAWYAWPALPLALWGLWRYRAQLLDNPPFQLLIVFFVSGFGLIGLGADTREIYAMPLLLPLALVAGGSVESLRRGAAGALNWFGIILFGMMGFLIWLGWFAMMTGWPSKLSERMHFLSGVVEPHLDWPNLIIALGITLIWLVVVANAKRSNRAAINDWAVGITMAWCLLMTIWLPWVDAARSYAPVMSSLKAALPQDYACITSRNLGSAQHALLDYYVDVEAQPFETVQRLNCDLYLIQDERGQEIIEPGHDWHLIWQGKRAADRRESFRLYQSVAATN